MELNNHLIANINYITIKIYYIYKHYRVNNNNINIFASQISNKINNKIMIKVKQINAVSAYNVLKQIKTKELPAEVAIAIWKNVKNLKGIATSYEEAIKDSKESLKGDNDEEMGKLLEELQKKETDEAAGKYTFTRTDTENRIKVTEYYSNVQNKLTKFIKELDNKEVEVEHITIKEDDLIKALIGTDFNIGVLELIDFLFEDAPKADDKENK